MRGPGPLIVGNWKMNGLGADLAGARRIADAVRERSLHVRVALCVPATLVERLSRTLDGDEVRVGGEDVHPEPSGAFTGDISAAMLADAGARTVIVGHSERRLAYAESDETVARKAEAAQRASLTPIICVGESAAERESGQALDRIRRQAIASTPASAAIVPFCLAYEPIWAVGGDRTPSSDDIARTHAALRDALETKYGVEGRAVELLYGGAVTPSNTLAILRTSQVSGVLVGRASISPDDFIDILEAANESSSRD